MPRGSALFLFLLVGVALGARGWFLLHAPQPEILQFAGRMSVVEGTIADDPDVRATSVRVPIEVYTINGTPSSGKLLAVLPRDTDLQYGDAVSVRGVPEEPQSFETNTGRTFDYPGYLRARGILVVIQHAVLRESTQGGVSVLRTLYQIKHSFERALQRVMQEPMASLMEGFLLGEKSGLPQALTQAFVVAGLIHVVVLSGYNIGVVSEWTLRFFCSIFAPTRCARDYGNSYRPVCAHGRRRHGDHPRHAHGAYCNTRAVSPPPGACVAQPLRCGSAHAPVEPVGCV